MKAFIAITSVFAICAVSVITAQYNRDSSSPSKSYMTTSYAATTNSAPSNLDLLRAIGKATVQTGYATDYDIKVFGNNIDFTISSLLPGDARFLATTVCGVALQKGLHAIGWTVRVFLPVGDRPAATCPI